MTSVDEGFLLKTKIDNYWVRTFECHIASDIQYIFSNKQHECKLFKTKQMEFLPCENVKNVPLILLSITFLLIRQCQFECGIERMKKQHQNFS